MARSFQVALALCALCIVAATAADASGFLADTLVGGKSSPKVKTSGYYGYADTEVACLSQLNFKSCRYTGCLDNDGSGVPTCWPASIFTQTDFTCCPKEHQYGKEGENMGVLGFSDKVGTCDWEISLYKWGSDTALLPVPTDDGTALKFGTAWGTCYLNSEAEHCDDPLCERMAISIQGGLYASCAYGDTAGPTAWATALDTCAATTGNHPLAALWPAIQDAVDTALGAICRGATPAPPRSAPASAKAPAAPKKTEAKIAYDHEETAQTLYAGWALIVSGPFYETSKHDDKIEETGLFEFAPYFSGGASAGTEPVNRWPVVRGKGAKLRFTREKESYGGEGHQQK